MASEPGGNSGRRLRTLFDAGTAVGLTDGQLLERFATRRGEAAELAFSALVERHGPMVLRACRGILRDDHEAMDAFQATFLVLAEKGGTLWVRESLAPWLHRVACRAAGRARAEAGRRRALERRAAGAAEARSTGGDGDGGDLAAVLHEEVDRLPERYRVPIVLCDLQGRTCEETARHIGCPVGTVGSRLSRGRERLRGRLARRGLAPDGGAGTPPAGLAFGAAVPPALAESAVQAGVRLAAWGSAAGAVPAAATGLARAVSRSLLVAKIGSVAAALAAVGGASLVVGLTFRAAAGFQPPAEAAGFTAEGPDEPKGGGLDLFVEQHKNFLMATVGNMRPLVKTKDGVSFQSREAVLYKDGTVKLWEMSVRSKDPVCPPLRHKDKIREVTFLDDAALLMTTSDGSVKLWDGITGALRKEIGGQVVRPLFFTDKSGAKRFVSIDAAGRTVTTWDVATLEPVGEFRPEGAARLIGAGLSGDGKTLATIDEDHSVTLWDATAKTPYATLRPPSRLVARVFVDNPNLAKATLQLDGPFWDSVKPLAPAEAEAKK